jgi:hypothetical protein
VIKVHEPAELKQRLAGAPNGTANAGSAAIADAFQKRSALEQDFAEQLRKTLTPEQAAKVLPEAGPAASQQKGSGS